MWYRHFKVRAFGNGFPPFDFPFHMHPFPRRGEYIKIPEDYRKELQEQLAEIKKDLEEMIGTGEG